MHPDYKAFSVEIPAHDSKAMKKANEALADYHSAMVVHEREVAEKLGIDFESAMLVVYLRSRSRWTQEKEDHLVKLARENKPLPNVLAGEF